MINVNVYGSGCKNCQVTAERILAAGHELGLEINVEKVTDLEKIMEAGVMRTPGVSVNGQLVHSGSVPSEQLIREFLG
ncbi:thioredoxin family protein [Parendozoicomonas haliclonae]|uniref:Thioredoxin-like fold domain-containing protein n=1 Tax=Parendozoicomonas haliclonae TaxID=1960125 RepID=A0A1X7AIW0_9GAMM|nr:thioredoxin family protein [Parendozoicomonas haliclonae]SMA45120.1 hypothetical protein EHSB41UT_01844 [Parendozoicomonas haliclonae]